MAGDDDEDGSAEASGGVEVEGEGEGEGEGEVEVSHSQVDTEVLFANNNVFAYPSRNTRIGGRLTLVKQHCVCFVSWIPHEDEREEEEEEREEEEEESKEDVAIEGNQNDKKKKRERRRRSQQQQQYALQPIPVSEIRYIRRHTPTLGWHYVVIVLKERSVSLPPLFFHLGGVRKFLSILKEHVALMRSEHDKNCYVVNEISEPIRRTLAPVQDQMDEQMLTGNPQQDDDEDEDEEEKQKAMRTCVPQNLNGESKSSQVGSILLDKAFFFSDFTRKAYDHTSYFLQDWKETFSDNHFAEEAAATEGQDEAAEQRGSGEEEDLSNSLSNSKLTPLDDDTLNTLHRKLQLTLEEGVDFLSTECGSFEFLDEDASKADSSGDLQGLDCYLGMRKQCEPLSQQELSKFRDGEGRFRDVEELRQRIFEGGCSPGLRARLYPYLLGYLPFDSTDKQRAELRRRKHKEYEQIKAQWTCITEEQAKKFSKYRERKVQIEKDVIRTDSTHIFYKGKMANGNVQRLRDMLLSYSFYNFDLGYCQGMSDLLAPLLYVMEKEAEADCFWCFVGLMDKMERNFDQDQSGMHNQLLALRKLVQLLDPQLYVHFENQQQCQNYLFCYRWLLLHFKREFSFDDCLRLWEALWTCSFCDQLHMYVCVAVLQQFRRKIIEADMTFDDLIQFTNGLSHRIPLEESLRNAEILCKFAGEPGLQVLATISPLE